jgi:hypothetical protein
MHNYTQIRVDLIAKGFSEIAASRIVSFIELDDIVTEMLHAEECRKTARAIELNQELLRIHARLMDECWRDWHETLRGITKPLAEERQQRQLLQEKGFREKPNLFLASVLKYFCNFDDHHVALITGVVYPPVALDTEPENGLRV